MARDDLDELFGGGEGQPAPRFQLALILLITGLTFAVAGMLCTAAPGGLLVLASWIVIDKELDRVESGYLPTDVRPRLQSLQRTVNLAVVFVVLLFVLQLFLLCNGTYETLWSTMLSLLLT